MSAVRKPKLFISHSAKEQSASALLDAIEQGLTEGGFDVLLDRTRLRPGTRWRDEIYGWTDTCHAAIVLVSPSALCSDWVKAEAMSLTQRWAVNPSFVLLPVFVDPATPEKLKRESWDAIRLRDVEGFAVDDADLAIERLLMELEPVVARYGSYSLLDDLELELAQKLKRPELDDEALARLAAEIETDLGWVRGTSKQLALARRALGCDLEALFTFADLLGRLSDRATAVAFYMQAVPYIWVEPQAAAQIAVIAAQPANRAAALNSARTETCAMYLSRANPAWRPHTMSGGWGENLLEDIVADAHMTLTKAVWRDADDRDRATLNRQLERRPYFVEVPAPLPDAEPAARLVTEFPSVTFLFLAGAITEEEFLARGLQQVAYVRPPLDPTREDDFFHLYSADLTALQEAA